MCVTNGILLMTYKAENSTWSPYKVKKHEQYTACCVCV